MKKYISNFFKNIIIDAPNKNYNPNDGVVIRSQSVSIDAGNIEEVKKDEQQTLVSSLFSDTKVL
ncbi:MAG: hypothetical protein HKM04_03430 [Legionellales bacterium]|nr:hypothetical protein [Legionellales bacterium]